MQNKEIEEYKEVLYDLINDEDVYNSIKKAVTGTFKYIDKLETDKQKLIEKLEERRTKNNDRYGKAIDNDEFPEMYEYSGQVQEDDYILEILKGEKNE